MTHQPFSQRRILVVDDEESILSAFERLISKDFTVVTARSLMDARLSLEKSGDIFSVVIADQKLPDGNGIALLRELKSRNPNTARILITGQLELNSIVEAINRAEIHRFILKPWDNDVLRAQIFEAAKLHDLLRERNEDDNCRIANRRYFHETLALTVEGATHTKSKFGIIVLDIDNFKNINDKYGHLAGDRLLQSVALQLRGLVPSQHIVARIGGDEFAVLCCDAELQTVTTLGKLIHRELITKVNNQLPQQLPVTISVGIAVCPDHAPAEHVLHCADLALLHAKRSGRNCIQLHDNVKDE